MLKEWLVMLLTSEGWLGRVLMTINMSGFGEIQSSTSPSSSLAQILSGSLSYVE